ncbi:MAG: vWA domain-containing protein, partial [Pseudomonadota bacterium]
AREIRRLVGHIGKRKFGLYTFADDVAKAVELGATPEQLAKALQRRRARESSTSLFAAIDVALDDLAALPASRRTLVLLGDGSTGGDTKTEDAIVDKAKRLNIPIFTIAFTDNRVDTKIKDGLKVLRSLADRTHGLFEDAGAPRILSDSYVNNFYHYIENGGEAEITSSLTGGDKVDAEIGLSNGQTIRIAGISVAGGRRVSETTTASNAVSETASDDTTEPDNDVSDTDDAVNDDDEDETEDDGSQLEAFLDDPATWAQDNPFPAISILVAVVGLGALGALVWMRPREAAETAAFHDDYADYGAPPHVTPDPALMPGSGNETVLLGVGGDRR